MVRSLSLSGLAGCCFFFCGREKKIYLCLSLGKGSPIVFNLRNSDTERWNQPQNGTCRMGSQPQTSRSDVIHNSDNRSSTLRWTTWVFKINVYKYFLPYPQNSLHIELTKKPIWHCLSTFLLLSNAKGKWLSQGYTSSFYGMILILKF